MKKIKLLVKKDFAQAFAGYFINLKTGKSKTTKQKILYGLLFVLLLGELIFQFGFAAYRICPVMIATGFDKLYFTITTVSAITIGMVFDILISYSAIFMVKDNDLLFSMPLKSSEIVFSRLVGIYITGFLFSAFVMLINMVVYFIFAGFNLANFVSTLLLMFILPLGIVGITALFDFVIAFLTSKARNQQTVSLIVTLIFVVLYSVSYSLFMQNVNILVENTIEASTKINAALGIANRIGSALLGNFIDLILISIGCFALSFIAYLILSASIIKLSTSNKGIKKKEFKQSMIVAKSVNKTLLLRELSHLKGSAVYLLNTTMGSFLLIVAAIASLIWGSKLYEVLFSVGLENYSFLIIAGACVVCSAMNDISAPSVSLEGSSVWIVRSMPISEKQVLKSKIYSHLLVTGIPAALFALSASIKMHVGFSDIIMILIISYLFILFTANVGLIIDLKMGNLNWMNETVAVKQGFNVLVSLLLNMVAAGVSVGLYFWLKPEPSRFLFSYIIVVAIAVRVMGNWINTKGCKLFTEL